MDFIVKTTTLPLEPIPSFLLSISIFPLISRLKGLISKFCNFKYSFITDIASQISE